MPKNDKRLIQVTPGPTLMHPEVQDAMRRDTQTHLSTDFFDEIRDVQSMLRKLFRTKNRHTGFLSGSGTLGNESGVQNLVHPGDTVVIGDMGWFSQRIKKMVHRRAPTGDMTTELISAGEHHTIEPDMFRDALAKHGKGAVAAAFLPKVETGTGTEIPSDDMREIAHIADEYEVPLVLDAVCALGGSQVETDEWGVGVVSGCSQKGLNASPGLAPITIRNDVMERVVQGKKEGRVPGSEYTDFEDVFKYFHERQYHHTPPTHLVYALRKSLQLLFERANGNFDKFVYAEHRNNQRALEVGMAAIGFENPVPLKKRANVVSVFDVPNGEKSVALQEQLLQVTEAHGEPINGIEVALGKGEHASRQIRIGLLGMWSTRKTVQQVLDGVDQVMGAGNKAVDAADQYYASLGTDE